MLWLIPTFPLAGFLVNGILGRRLPKAVINLVAIGSVVLSFAWVLKTLLGLGAGDLEAIDGNQHVVKRWCNVLFLYFAWPKLDEILHQRAAVVESSPESPVEVEDVKKS